MTQRLFHVGSSPAIRTAIQKAFGKAPTDGPATGLGAGDVVVVEAFDEIAARADVVGGNAFSACRAWKQTRGVIVYVAVRAEDPTGVLLARFVLADGVILLDANGGVEGLEHLGARDRSKTHKNIDTLLERYGKALANADQSELAGRVREWEGSDSFLQRLQDPETGLFDGPYTALKLDEEWKRAQRFHLPLSIVLLDIGEAAAAMREGPDRSVLLAEVASVFLNECRDIDVLGRFTTTTFLFLLPGTPPLGAQALARRLMQSLRERSFSAPVRPACGVVSVPMAGISDRRQFLVVAEECLRRATEDPSTGGVAVAWE
jgi:diguanylate cyclase (GGDEF)-like protein